MSDGFLIDDFLRVTAYENRFAEVTPAEPKGPRQVPSKEDYFIGLLPAIAARSKDPRNQVGCIIVGEGGEIRATGFNGFPAGVIETEDRWTREEKVHFVCHAEANAIAAAAKVGTPLAECTAYVSFAPCTSCAKLLISAGIWEVIVDRVNHDRVITDRWAKDQEKVEAMFDEAGINFVWWTRKGARENE